MLKETVHEAEDLVKIAADSDPATMAMAFSTTHRALVNVGQLQLLAGPCSSCKFGVVAVAVGRKRCAGERLMVRANGDMLGDFGARDPTAGELGSNFGEKTLGNASTEHQILVPTLSVLKLSERTIKPLAENTAPMTEGEAKALLRKVVGWRLVNLGSSEAGLKLQCDWLLKDAVSVTELSARISKVAEEAENYPYEIQTLDSNKVRVEIWTASIGGLSENDFIFASKIDQVETKDLTRRLRTWF